MKFKRKNIGRKVITTLIVFMLMGSSVAFGVGYNKQITAWFYNIQVKLNGGSLNFSKEPFIYDGSVYIPLRDVSENLGLEVTWDDATKTVYLASNGTYSSTYSTPSSYSSGSQYVLINKKSISEIENELNNDYDEYTDGEEDLEFNYDLSEKSSYIKVKMEGENFKKSSTDWEERDDSDFRDFVEDVAKMVADELDKDVKIYVYDEKDKSTAEYEYDESEDKFSTESEYGEDDADASDIEDMLEDDYDEYTGGSDDLEFSYDVSEKSSYIKVIMEGQNFKVDSSDWEDRDDSDFREFIENIAEAICDEIDDMDVKIYVEDEDGDTAARYEYDESDSDLNVDSEYGGSDESDVESDLNDDYDEYTEGEEKLEFEYNVSEDTDDVDVEMEGQNFKANSSDWIERDEDKFQDFVEDVAKKVADEFDKDVNIDVTDEDDVKVGEYEYDEGRDDFEVKDEYDTEQILNDIEDELNQDYDEYTKGDSGDLRFDYELAINSRSDYIEVEMKATNFERSDSAWDDRDDSDFRSFVKDVAVKINDVFDEMDVKVYVKDENDSLAARYLYDESDNDLDVEDEY